MCRGQQNCVLQFSVCSHYPIKSLHLYSPIADSEAVKARALANVQSAFSNQETSQQSFMTIDGSDLQETCKSVRPSACICVAGASNRVHTYT